MLALYEQAKAGQWNASTDIAWETPVPFGEPLGDDSAFVTEAFEMSSLGRFGRPFWDVFRWEFQSWMVSQFLHGEQGALVATARLVEVLPTVEGKLHAAGQVVDEARHLEAFSRYLREHVPEPYPISSPLADLLGDTLSDARWDVAALGMQVIVEGIAMAAFRLADSSFHDDLIRQIARMVARDEARHVAFGVIALEGLYDEMTSAERAEREEFVLEAADLMRRRFLLEDVWDRLGVARSEGVEFALSNPMMTQYRQTVFAKVVSTLRRIGLLSSSVTDGLAAMGLLGGAAGRLAGRLG
ncbi:MAG: ferritin-like domain-containing protein [Actinobacteria bacterium]|nr:ferritin-like domain-containing protein [Actinomycetota bacterium]